MKMFTIAVVAVCCLQICLAAEIDRDAVARKLGNWDDWKHFNSGKSIAWNLQGVDSSKFTSAEIDYLINWARNEEEHRPDSTREGCRVGFVILVKFKDKRALEHVERQFARGYFRAFDAMESLEMTGELSLIPLAAKYLYVNTPVDPEPPTGDVGACSAPSVSAAAAINSLLRFGYQSPKAIRDAASDLARNQLRYLRFSPDGIEWAKLYRRWWEANKQSCLRGEFATLTSPMEYLEKGN